jgi:secreted trypsin-like serine protease
LVIASTVLGYVATASAIIVRPDRDDRLYRELATKFPAVCWIPDDDPRGTRHGTGTLIAPRWVLTAAHVVDGGTDAIGDKVVETHRAPATQVQIAGKSFRIQRIVLYPKYQPTKFKEGQCDDIALIELVEPVRDVSPIPIHVANDEVGQLAYIVGFGWTGTFDTGQPNGNMASYFAEVPTKRAATNVIDAVDGNLLITTIDPPSSATDLEGSLATADSGGPLLVQVDGHYKVAGVAHILYGDEARFQRFGGQDAYIRVSTYSHWIEDVTGEDFDAPMMTLMWVLASGGVLLACGFAMRRRTKGNKSRQLSTP